MEWHGKKWSSYYQRQIAALKTVRAMFKKKVDNTPSVFDELELTTKLRLQDDILKIVRIFAQWPALFTSEQKDRIGTELKNLFTATASKLALAMVKGSELEQALPGMFGTMKMPEFAKIVIENVKNEFKEEENGVEEGS